MKNIQSWQKVLLVSSFVLIASGAFQFYLMVKVYEIVGRFGPTTPQGTAVSDSVERSLRLVTVAVRINSVILGLAFFIICAALVMILIRKLSPKSLN